MPRPRPWWPSTLCRRWGCSACSGRRRRPRPNSRRRCWIGCGRQSDYRRDSSGVIQDSASSATLAAVHHHAGTGPRPGLEIKQGLAANPQVRIYASDQVHTSIDRAIWIAGNRRENNLVRIPTSGPIRGHGPDALDVAIKRATVRQAAPAGRSDHQRRRGRVSEATDDVAAVCEVASRYDLYHPCRCCMGRLGDDLPRVSSLLGGRGARRLDRPQSAQVARRAIRLLRPLSCGIRPAWCAPLPFIPLVPGDTQPPEGFVDYSEWSIPLGRRFRALQALVPCFRAYGLEYLRTMIRNHVRWADELREPHQRGNRTSRSCTTPHAFPLHLSLCTRRNRPISTP